MKIYRQGFFQYLFFLPFLLLNISVSQGQSEQNKEGYAYWEGELKRFRDMRELDIDSASQLLEIIKSGTKDKFQDLFLFTELEEQVSNSYTGDLSEAKAQFDVLMPSLKQQKKSLERFRYERYYYYLAQEDTLINGIDSLQKLITEIEAFSTPNEIGKNRIWWSSSSLLSELYLDKGFWSKGLEVNYKILELETEDSVLINQRYFTVYVQGWINFKIGQFEEAKESFSKTWNLAEKVGDIESRDIMARTVHYIGQIYQVNGDTVLWKAHTEEAIRIFEELGTENLIPPLLDLVDYHIGKNEFKEAESLLVRAQKLIKEKGLENGYLVAGVCLAKASYEYGLGNLEKAISCAKKSMEVHDGADLKVMAFRQLAGYEGENGNYKSAFKNLSEYLDLYTQNLNEEQIRKTENLKRKHELNVKEKETELLRGQKKAQGVELEAQKSIVLWAMIFLGLAIGLIVYLARIWNRLRITNKQLEEQKAALRIAKEEAESASKAKAEFLSVMSHEIRTPMNGVIGMTDLIASTELTEEQHQFVDTISSSADSLLAIINDILDFSKIESGKMEIEQAPISLRNCVEEVLDLFSAKASDSGLDLLYYLEPNVPEYVIGDSVRLKQVLSNLTSNAIKFTPNGEVLIKVYLTDSNASKAGGNFQVAFRVQDSGIGISQAAQQKLFQSFSQVDASTTRNYGGTGLGLTISRQLSKLMGGEIWVESEEGKGSAFTFTIKTELSPSAEEDVRTTFPAFAQKYKVLIVDDNLLSREILQLQLKEWGLEPETCSSSLEAYAKLSDPNDFDLLITDRHMPKEDGVSFYTKLKRKYGQKTLPALLLSSVGHSETEKELFKDIITKPIRRNIFHRTILDVFQGGQEEVGLSLDSHHCLNQTLSEQYPLTILVAEDNPVNQKLVMRMLNKMGYHADLACNGKEAWDKVQGGVYDILFMDVQMPMMDGIEATRNILSDLRITNPPRIIAMTANATQEDLHACLNAGMEERITKPFRSQGLKEILIKYATTKEIKLV